MKWKASSHDEAIAVLQQVARNGVRKLEELDILLTEHCAKNDLVFDPEQSVSKTTDEACAE